MNKQDKILILLITGVVLIASLFAHLASAETIVVKGYDPYMPRIVERTQFEKDFGSSKDELVFYFSTDRVGQPLAVISDCLVEMNTGECIL